MGLMDKVKASISAKMKEMEKTRAIEAKRKAEEQKIFEAAKKAAYEEAREDMIIERGIQAGMEAAKKKHGPKTSKGASGGDSTLGDIKNLLGGIGGNFEEELNSIKGNSKNKDDFKDAW